VLFVAAMTFAALGASPKLAATRCPQAPFAAPAVAGPAPAGLTCPALEISGSVDRNDGASLDPSFDVSVAPSRFPANPPTATDAVLQGYSAEGRQLFIMPIEAGGQFHTYVPLADGVRAEVARIRLTVGGSYVDRIAAVRGIEPTVEAISVDDSRAIIAWNGLHFPGIRVRESPNGPLVAEGVGNTSYDQLTVTSRASLLLIDFSDGVHSVTRPVSVFGR
jgi:hypothetical protein